MEQSKYFLGLDIGTESVGFAVTDENYNVIKKGKKRLIGVRLFEAGNTAAERRGFRTSRRRLERKKERVSLLRKIFEEEINKIDPFFFRRLDESMFHLEDKECESKSSLFNDGNYKDREYFSEYKTIYHLRKDLKENKTNDPRLLYLAIAHIIKNRGHFLFQGADFSEVSKFSTAYETFESYLAENYSNFALGISHQIKIEEILKNKELAMSEKEREIIKLVSASPEQKLTAKLIVGGSVELGKIFGELDEEAGKEKICFKKIADDKYEEILGKLDEHTLFIEYAKSIYDWSVLNNILDVGKKQSSKVVTISDAKVYKYDTHQEELKGLKAMVKKYLSKNDYREIFVDEKKEINYPSYIGSTLKNGKKQILMKGICSQEDLCKYILKKFEEFKNIKIMDESEEKEIVEKLKMGKLLNKLRTKDNSVIPYQIHLKELEIILKNHEDIFPFLLELDKDITNEEKIKKIFLYRIPYYVGPLGKVGDFVWAERNTGRENEKIYPWNIDKVVNFEKSAEKFIRRMTNKCTYLKDKDVIPENSLYYTKYKVLNELNNLKINGQEITVELKQEIFENLFMQQKKVSTSALKNYLIKNSYADKDVSIAGIDGDFKSNLAPYIEFNQIMAEFNYEMIEDIILWITLFSEDKKMLDAKISSKYNLTEKEMKAIKKMKFSGWGRLSKELLTEIEAPDKLTGEMLNILDKMYNSNLNLMQVLSKENGYMEKIEELNEGEKKEKILLSDVKDLYCSPSVKKGIWQAVGIVKEVEKIMGRPPVKLFIEMTRADGEKGKTTTSRKKDLVKKYQAIKNEYLEIFGELEGRDERDLRQKKLFLYFTQTGRCAYTNEEISLDQLFTNDYDVEHIYPRSKTKDDSIHDNLVLVKRIPNAEKSDKYPIPKEYRQPMLWKFLHDKKLITNEKYKRLARTTEFEPRELEGFIARQLVETSQSTKAVATLFSKYFKDNEEKVLEKHGFKSQVVYVKAGNVSAFRQHFDIPKVREINDYHHAHDAYLNIVVGNAYDTKFTKKFFKNIQSENYSLKPEVFYKWDIKHNDYFAWKKDETIKTVKENIENNKILFTRHSYTASGAFYDQTIYKKGQGGEIPVKMKGDYARLMDLSKYGGHKSIKGAYFILVEHEQKKKVVRTIEYIPVYLDSRITTNQNVIDNYLMNVLGLKNHKIIVKKLKFGALLNIDGMPAHISGRTGNQIVFRGAVQLNLRELEIKYLKKVSKFVSRLKENEKLEVSTFDGINEIKNLEIYDIFTEKLNSSIYKIRLAAQAKTLLANRSNFQELSLEQQSLLLVNMLTLFKCNPAKADLSLIKGAKAVGTIIIGKNIKDRTSAKLINQSITGYYEEVIDLLK